MLMMSLLIHFLLLLLLERGSDVLLNRDESVFVGVGRNKEGRDVFLLEVLVHGTHFRRIDIVVLVLVERQEILLVSIPILVLRLGFTVPPLGTIQE